MTNPTTFERQLADFVWMMTTALRAAYDIRDVFEQLAAEAPEPTASACAQVVADLNNGLTYEEAFANWQEAVQSAYLDELVAAILKHRHALANLLDPIGEVILNEAGTDGAFYPAMRRLAQRVGASPPQRAQEY